MRARIRYSIRFRYPLYRLSATPLRRHVSLQASEVSLTA